MARSSKQRIVEPKAAQTNNKPSKRNVEVKSKSTPVVSDTSDNLKIAKSVDKSKPVQIPGCLTCRQRHLKCSRTQPACQQCIKSKYICYWKKEGTKFSDYDIKLTSVSEPQGCVLDPVRDSTKDSNERKLMMKDKETVNIMNEISLMSNDPGVMMIHDAVSVFSERIKDIEPELNFIDNVELPSLTANRVSNKDAVEHHESAKEVGSNRTFADNESIIPKKKLHFSSQSLFENSFSELEEKLHNEIDNTRETGRNCKVDETESQLTIYRHDTESDSWSDLASQANSPSAPPIKLLLEFQDRVKELEASVQASHPNTTPFDPQIDWYTNSVFPHIVNGSKEQMSTNIEKDISTALAIANILETRLIDNEVDEMEEQGQFCDSFLPNVENTGEAEKAKQLKVSKIKKHSRKSHKSELKDTTTLTIPDVREMKERIERLYETLEKANKNSNKDVKQDGRRYRYSHGLKAVDSAKLPPSITKFMRA